MKGNDLRVEMHTVSENASLFYAGHRSVYKSAVPFFGYSNNLNLVPNEIMEYYSEVKQEIL